MAIEQVAFLEILTFVVGALLFVGIGTLVSFSLRPHNPNQAKLRTYESGEDPTGSSWGKFHTRYYIIAIVFMLFEIEMVLLVPWTTIWAHHALNEATSGLWAHYTAISTMLFVMLLTIGLAHVWRQGHLAGIQPPMPASSLASTIPKVYYDRVNSRYATMTQKDTAHSENVTSIP